MAGHFITAVTVPLWFALAVAAAPMPSFADAPAEPAPPSLSASEAAEQIETEVHLRDELDWGLGIGLGVLEFFFLDVHYTHSSNWLFGLALGGFPVDDVLNNAMGLDNLSVGAVDESLMLQGDVETRLGALGLYAQWFPWEGVFYLRGGLALWNLEASARGSLIVDGQTDDGLEVVAKAGVAVPMLGFGVGWRFQAKFGLFFDLALGFRIFLSPEAEVEFGGATIDELNKNPEIAILLESAQNFMAEALEAGANRITSDVGVFPNATLRVGWTFDLMD